MSTFLQLAPEFGGTRFGPFPGAVRLGSAAGQNEIVLNVPGLAPVHAMVLSHGNGTFTVQPAAMGNAVFLVRGGAQPMHVGGAVQAAPGDSVVLGHAAGPRFILQWQPQPGAAAPGAISGPGAGAYMGRMADQVKIEARYQMFRNIPGLRVLDMWLFRARSGSLFHPRYIAAALMTVVVVFGGALLTLCAGAAAMVGLDLPIGR